jgi:hypothetical protein
LGPGLFDQCRGENVASNTGKVQCSSCKGWYRRKVDDLPYKHQCVPVSDPAPTVEETTTQGDDVSDKGPWFGAMYDGRCSVNECAIFEGDRIRADGEGGYECEDCGDSQEPEELMVGPLAGTEAYDWQQQASTAARRHVNGVRPTVGIWDEAQGFMNPAAVTAEEFMDPAATEDVKPLVSVSGQPKKVRRDHQDRYAVVLPGEAELEVYKTSGNPVGRTRVTSFVKQASSTIKLGEWKARNVVIGAARRRDLLLKAQGLTHENDRDRLNAIVKELEETAGAKVGSDLGTYLHDFTEYMDAGLKDWQQAPQEFQRSLALYADALRDAGLEPIKSLIERTTIIREFGWVCGTFDRIFFHRPSGQYVIGDLKTAKTMDYGKNEIEAQLWAYAHGVNQNGIYDWNTDTWVTDWQSLHGGRWHPEVSETVGVVIHMPVQGPKEGTVELLWADLEAGARHAELCQSVRTQPKGKMRPWGDGPAPLAPPSWEDRFRAVRSNGEASALWREAKAAGVKGRHLEDYIDLARQSLRLISFGMDVRG